VDAINNTKSKVTGMKPVDVNFYNSQALRRWMYARGAPRKGEKMDLEKGDTVRVAKQRTAFTKSYLPNFTNEVYEIDRPVPGHPDTYHLKTTEGKEVTGKFYGPELSRTKKPRDKSLVIEEVLNTRMRRNVQEYFVKFKGKSDEESAWITEADLL
jgi:hypothetical protein